MVLPHESSSFHLKRPPSRARIRRDMNSELVEPFAWALADRRSPSRMRSRSVSLASTNAVWMFVELSTGLPPCVVVIGHRSTGSLHEDARRPEQITSGKCRVFEVGNPRSARNGVSPDSREMDR
jgi:hypothetical protein